MQIALTILSLIPIVLQLIKSVETIFSGASTGPAKKAAVIGALSVILNGLVATGIIKTPDAAIVLSRLNIIIDAAVDTANSFTETKNRQASAKP